MAKITITPEIRVAADLYWLPESAPEDDGNDWLQVFAAGYVAGHDNHEANEAWVKFAERKAARGK